MQSKYSVSKKSLLALIVLSIFASAIYVAPMVKAPYGPRLAKVRFSVIKTPDAQVAAMKMGEVDMYPGLIRPGDVDELTTWGANIISTPGGHMCYVTFNLRNYTGEYGFPRSADKAFLLDVNFRHALAHLVPKEVLIGTIFKYIVVRVDTVIVPQQGKWHNPNVPIHDYNPGDPFTSTAGDGSACGILKQSFYFQDRGTIGEVDLNDFWSYDAAGNEPLGEMDFLSPSYEEAPTSYTIVSTTIDEMKAVGLNNVNHLGVTFTVMLDNYVYPQTFDMYFLCWSNIGDDPDNIWAFFHSINDAYRGRNHPGLHEPVIDALAEIVHTSLDEDEVLAAAHQAQALLMSDTEDYGISYIPIYSRNYFDAFHPDLEGIVNEPLYGTDNGWTFLNMRWDDGVGPHGDNSMIYVVGTDVLTLNPLTANSADEVEVWGSVFGALDSTNPYTLDDIRGMAKYRNISRFDDMAPGTLGWVDGMRFTYNLKSGLKWHDGVDFTTADIEFCFDYMATYQPALWTDVWDDFVGTNVINTTMIEVYYNRTSLWLKDTVGGVAALLPKHIWEGVTDWEHFNLWEEQLTIDIPGAPAGTKMTKLVGTGAWIFEKIDPISGECVVWRNPDYYRSQSEVETLLADMFYWYGDINSDASVDIVDLVYIGLAWASWPGHDRWNELADLITDQFIDIEDARVSGASYGKKKWY